MTNTYNLLTNGLNTTTTSLNTTKVFYRPDEVTDRPFHHQLSYNGSSVTVFNDKVLTAIKISKFTDFAKKMTALKLEKLTLKLLTL